MAATASHPLLEFVARFENGTSEAMADCLVKAYDATNNTDLDDLGTTDSEGLIAPANLTAAVGITVRARIENFRGITASGQFITLEPI